MAIGVAILTAATEALNVVTSLAFGQVGAILLGDFVFDGFEVPSHIQFGGGQGMTVHRLVGGERVVDLLGADEMDISWSGTFINSTGINLVRAGLDRGDKEPEMRVRQLEQMRADGKPLPLQWGDNYYTVFIKSLRFETKYSHVPYDISCLVLRNEATAPQPEPYIDTTSSLTDDLNSASDSAPASAAPAVAQAQEALPVPPIPPTTVPPVAGEALPIPPIPPGTPAEVVTQQAVAAEQTAVVAPLAEPLTVPTPGFLESLTTGLQVIN
jgi:hypothetical protein